MMILSSAFDPGKVIPKKYTCKGENASPPLTITDVPSNAKTLVLIVEDPDAPGGVFTHWLLWNIPADVREIHEGTIPPNAVQGTNSFGTQKYQGPCPPEGEHHYVFTLYALDTAITLPGTAKKDALEKEIHGHILTDTSLTGLFASDSL